MPNRTLRRRGRGGFEGGVRGACADKPLTSLDGRNRLNVAKIVRDGETTKIEFALSKGGGHSALSLNVASEFWSEFSGWISAKTLHL